MIGKVKVPKVSTNVEEAQITGWFKREGEPIKKGEPLAELTTEKVCVELESPYTGMVRRILAPVKSVLPVGYVVALIGGSGDALPDVAAANEALLEKHRRASAGARRQPLGASRQVRAAVRATPAARRLARELGVDLADVSRRAGAEVVSETMVRDFAARESS